MLSTSQQFLNLHLKFAVFISDLQNVLTSLEAHLAFLIMLANERYYLYHCKTCLTFTALSLKLLILLRTLYN